MVVGSGRLVVTLELGTEVAASLVPGGGVAVKIIGKITAPAKD